MSETDPLKKQSDHATNLLKIPQLGSPLTVKITHLDTSYRCYMALTFWLSDLIIYHLPPSHQAPTTWQPCCFWTVLRRNMSQDLWSWCSLCLEYSLSKTAGAHSFTSLSLCSNTPLSEASLIILFNILYSCFFNLFISYFRALTIIWHIPVISWFVFFLSRYNGNFERQGLCLFLHCCVLSTQKQCQYLGGTQYICNFEICN